MQTDYVILAILFWAFLPIATHGLGNCPVYSASYCTKMTEKCDSVYEDITTVVCCNLTQSFHIKERIIGKNIKHLHVLNASIENLPLHADTRIETLSITGGNIKMISLAGKYNNLNCLNLSNNHLINVTIQSSMPKLRTMDFSNNNLTSLLNKETILHTIQNCTNFSIDISGNNEISCTNVEWLLDKKYSIHLKNKHDTYCLFKKSFEWFNSAFPINLPLLGTTQCEAIEAYGCRCGISRFIPPSESQPLLIWLNVNCSNLQLKSLPTDLPPYTVSLDVSNNNITSLDQMKKTSYSRVRNLYAQNNFISSISVLEGTPFISNFSILDVRRNNLTSVPTYFLSNRLDRNIASDIRLGGNKLLCDCNTAQILKLWLSVHKKYVQDYEEIGCRNLPKSVMQLDQLDVCVTQRNWTDYIYYIIAGEVTLLIFLVSKVSYDYWVFKTAGYLPWPASKMPKLPCDWVFEK